MDKCLQRAKYNKINIPYRILQYAVETNSFRSVQILVTCKLLFGGVFNDCETDSIASVLRVHPKTIKAHLEILKNKNMIGYDHVSGLYFNRGWNYLRIILQDKSTAGYRIRLDQMKKFKAFAIAASYDQLIKAQKYQSWLKRRERGLKGTSKQIGYARFGYYPVANEAYAKIYGVSRSTASRYRKMAMEAGFIDLKETLEPVVIDLMKSFSREMFEKYRKEYLVYRKGKFFIQRPSVVKSHLVSKKINRLR